jgi:arylsulfate sulfotransferase
MACVHANQHKGCACDQPMNKRRRMPLVAPGWLTCALLVAVFLQLAACNDNDSSIAVTGVQQGPTPFISFVELTGDGLRNLTGVRFAIERKPGSASKPVQVRYSLAALKRKGDFTETGDSRGTIKITVPVFGLYAGYSNHVSFGIEFQNDKETSAGVIIETPDYTDPNGLYDRPNVLTSRRPGTRLGFDFFVLKSGLGSPVVLDTDGEIRWVAGGISNSQSAIIAGDGFLIGGNTTPVLYQLGFDGLLSQSTVPDPTYTKFHHNIDSGKQGVLAEMDATVNGVKHIESILAELGPDGSIIKQWDLADIVSAYMSAQGDDAGAFVRPGTDWFHVNAATYDARDDSLLVSSRENFLIKLDYNSGDIIWILGDPHKYWYTFASLRAKALTLESGGLFPIGQHAVSVTSDGLIMLFNNGLGSRNQPTGAPPGDDRGYTEVSAYAIDQANGSAREVWHFDYGQTIFSAICGSTYEAGGGSLLVDFATAQSITQTRLVGLDKGHTVVFDFSYPTTGCATGWNAVPIALDNLDIT